MVINVYTSMCLRDRFKNVDKCATCITAITILSILSESLEKNSYVLPASQPQPLLPKLYNFSLD